MGDAATRMGRLNEERKRKNIPAAIFFMYAPCKLKLWMIYMKIWRSEISIALVNERGKNSMSDLLGVGIH